MEKETETKKTEVRHIDYKDVTKLRNQLNPHSRMYNRRRTGFTAREQRDFARATKRARYMALVPYVSY